MAYLHSEIPPREEPRIYQCIQQSDSNITLCREGTPAYLIKDEYQLVTIPSYIPKSADSIILKVAVGKLNILKM